MQSEVTVRFTECRSCGAPDRLIADTEREVISECYACGDEVREPRESASAVPVVQTDARVTA